jgi:hypothetical protein
MARRALPVASTTTSAAALALALVATAGGCIEAFDGSNLQIDFSEGTPTSARPGAALLPHQPPADTHFELYAADLVYRTDPDGGLVLDPDGNPIIDRSYVFRVTEFEIRPVIDTGSPCLIDLDESAFPGLHVSQFFEKTKEFNAPYTDPFEPGVPSGVVSDLLNAQRRVDNLQRLENQLKAITSHQAFRYPPTAAAGQCPPAAGALPHPTCFDDRSNAQRLEVCRALWADHTDYYEGSDKVFTLPLNGHYLGMVEGRNPLNDADVGGSSMFVDANLVGHDAYVLNWQYDDLTGPGDEPDGVPDFPADLPEAQRSRTGFLFMSGAPVEIARGVITVPLRHPIDSAIQADLAIIPNLGHDDVHF